jgi:hypothetical protein
MLINNIFISVGFFGEFQSFRNSPKNPTEINILLISIIFISVGFLKWASATCVDETNMPFIGWDVKEHLLLGECHVLCK